MGALGVCRIYSSYLLELQLPPPCMPFRSRHDIDERGGRCLVTRYLVACFGRSIGKAVDDASAGGRLLLDGEKLCLSATVL